MEQSTGDGGGGGEHLNLSFSGADAGEDRLTALPEDILVLILLRLDTITEAARTCVLSRRWRRIWTLLPKLKFCLPHDCRHIGEVLASSEAPALRQIHVVTNDESPASVAAWLPLAARRLSGALLYHNRNMVAEEEVVGGAIPLPCFGNATAIELDLGFLALALPSSGEFTRLTELCLERVQFKGTCGLGDVISFSSPQCPGLRKLSLRNTRGPVSLAVCSESLLQMELRFTHGLLQLKIDAPVLEKLTLQSCFERNRPIADISAPQLVSLCWWDAYDPSSVELGNLGQLHMLSTNMFLVYWQPNNRLNRQFLWLLQRFQFIHSLNISFGYAKEIHGFQYLMEDIKVLPNVISLRMSVINQGHSFGASSFHVLRLCTGIRRLSLVVHTGRQYEAQSTCSLGCICDQPTNWKIEELSLNCLKEVDVFDLKGVEHEVSFLKQLFKWAVVLKKLKIIFYYSVSKINAKEFCQKLLSISRPETLMEFCIYRDSGRRSVELLLLEDEGTTV